MSSFHSRPKLHLTVYILYINRYASYDILDHALPHLTFSPFTGLEVVCWPSFIPTQSGKTFWTSKQPTQLYNHSPSFTNLLGSYCIPIWFSLLLIVVQPCNGWRSFLPFTRGFKTTGYSIVLSMILSMEETLQQLIWVTMSHYFTEFL